MHLKKKRPNLLIKVNRGVFKLFGPIEENWVFVSQEYSVEIGSRTECYVYPILTSMKKKERKKKVVEIKFVCDDWHEHAHKVGSKLSKNYMVSMSSSSNHWDMRISKKAPNWNIISAQPIFCSILWKITLFLAIVYDMHWILFSRMKTNAFRRNCLCGS